MKRIFLFIVVVVAVFFTVRFFRTPQPVVEVSPEISAIGQSTPVSVKVQHPRGVRSIVALVQQNGSTYRAWEMSQPTQQSESQWNFATGSKALSQLKDGKAQLVIEATSNGLLKKTSRWRREVTIVTQPPSVIADSDRHYLYRGMADLATMSLSGSWTEAGVRVGDQTFRAWPMPDGKPGYFSLFAFVWNTPEGTVPAAYATDAAGNEVTSPLVVHFPKREQPKYSVRNLQLDDKFIQKVVNELDPGGTGDMVQRFLRINNEMRREDNKTLSDLRIKTADRFLWSQPFLRQAGAQTEASFADHRKYIYKGQQIDEQVHLGYDLAVTQHVGVQSANDGKVVFAAPLGIYGNCIVVDHGYGLQSIYGHLSQINVKEGDMVKRGQVMGLSGMTGMAGGDHIHFTMQLDGVQIDPKSWWDSHWIEDHITNRVTLPVSAD